ncbi:hypothetical protein L3X38_009468 [Prunus dulcis]|uniref:Uncharacterized protein n=1 Tax=Prunus dulcis TaxID=3755 RepID=A0AAD4WEM2_PRUDU|nr:hypothetical protein L3X38_009468 [Prunus dulcis]
MLRVHFQLPGKSFPFSVYKGYSFQPKKKGLFDQRLINIEEKGGKRKLKILIAGGGIGGLVMALAMAAKHRGFDVEGPECSERGGATLMPNPTFEWCFGGDGSH